MPSKDTSDFTPDSEAPTDIAPLGRAGRKPAHELTAQEDDDVANWNAIAADPEFKQLLSAKGRFILLATIFFIIYYFTLLVLVGWFPDVMERKVIGEVNWASVRPLAVLYGVDPRLSLRGSRCWLGPSARLLCRGFADDSESEVQTMVLPGVQHLGRRSSDSIPLEPLRCPAV